MKPHPLTPDEAVQIVGKRSFPDWLDAAAFAALARQNNQPRPVVRFFSDAPTPQLPKASPAYARAIAQYDAVERWITEHVPASDFGRATLDAALATSRASLAPGAPSKGRYPNDAVLIEEGLMMIGTDREIGRILAHDPRAQGISLDAKVDRLRTKLAAERKRRASDR